MPPAAPCPLPSSTHRPEAATSPQQPPPSRPVGDPVADWPTGRLLSTAARLVEHAWDAHLARWDLNHASFAVLHLLREEAMTQRELADLLQVQEQTMSRMLDRMERSGYVSRSRSPVDRRKMQVACTPAGHRARRGAAEDPAGDVEGGFLRVLGPQGTAELRTHLTAVVERLAQQRWFAPGD